MLPEIHKVIICIYLGNWENHLTWSPLPSVSNSAHHKTKSQSGASTDDAFLNVENRI